MASSAVTINIGSQFSRFPAGRTPDDGKYNGQTFRDKYLKENLNSGTSIKILLDDAISYGSSFLEEAFGGLVRVYGFEESYLKDKLSLESCDPFLVEEIWGYISDAALSTAASR